jgi:hypothetical protein
MAHMKEPLTVESAEFKACLPNLLGSVRIVSEMRLIRPTYLNLPYERLGELTLSGQPG